MASLLLVIIVCGSIPERKMVGLKFGSQADIAMVVLKRWVEENALVIEEDKGLLIQEARLV